MATDIHAIQKHVESLSDKNLRAYLRLVMRNGMDDRAAVADMEMRRRMEER